MFKKSVLRELEDIKGRYPEYKSAVLPALYIAQREFGWLSNEAILSVAKSLSIPEALVRGTASFYSMFKQRQAGRHLIQMCTNISCMILDAERLVDFVKSRYSLEPGGTSPDGRFSLVIMECIGACGTAPAMLVDTDFYDNLTEKKIEEVLNKYI